VAGRIAAIAALALKGRSQHPCRTPDFRCQTIQIVVVDRLTADHSRFVIASIAHPETSSGGARGVVSHAERSK
jgi:hypothetical protein